MQRAMERMMKKSNGKKLKCEDCDFEWTETVEGWELRFIYCPRCGCEYTGHNA